MSLTLHYKPWFLWLHDTKVAARYWLYNASWAEQEQKPEGEEPPSPPSPDYFYGRES